MVAFLNILAIYFSVFLLVKSSSIFLLFSKLRSEEIEQFNSGIKNLKKFLTGISRGDLFLKKVKEFRLPVDEKQSSLVNKVRNFRTSNDFIATYVAIFISSLFVFGGIQLGKYLILKSNAIEIRLSYSQIKNTAFYNIYQNLGIIKIMEVIQNESKGIPPSPKVLESYNSLLDNVKEKSFRFQLNSCLPTFKKVFLELESVSACEELRNTSFSCSTQFEEIFFFNAFRSTFMDSIILMKKFNRMLKAKNRQTFLEKKDLMAETSTVSQNLVRLVSVFNKVNDNLNENLKSATQSQLSTTQNFLILEIFVSILVLFFGGLVIFFFLNNLSMEKSSFIKVLPFNLIVRNQYFKIYLNKNKY